MNQTNEAQWLKYDRENPQIYEMFKRFTLELINARRVRFGASAIIERLRWEAMTTSNGRFKMNNNYSAFYSRKFVAEFPQYSGFFRMRKAKADSILINQ